MITCPATTDDLDRLAAACSAEVRDTDYVLRQSSEVIVFMPGGDHLGPGAALTRIRNRWTHPDELRVRRAVIGQVAPSAVFSSELRQFREDHRPVEVFG